MAYQISDAVCEWCAKSIDDGADVACGKCYSKAESDLYDAQREIEKLKERIADLEETP